MATAKLVSEQLEQQDIQTLREQVDALAKSESTHEPSSKLKSIARLAQEAKKLAESSTQTANSALNLTGSHQSLFEVQTRGVVELQRQLVEVSTNTTHDMNLLWAYLKKVMDGADATWRVAVGYEEPLGDLELLRLSIQPRCDRLVTIGAYVPTDPSADDQDADPATPSTTGPAGAARVPNGRVPHAAPAA